MFMMFNRVISCSGRWWCICFDIVLLQVKLFSIIIAYKGINVIVTILIGCVFYFPT